MAIARYIANRGEKTVTTIAEEMARSEGPKKGKRGSVRNDRRLEAIARRRSSAAADWGGCDSEKIQGVVVGITALGGAVTFGTSRDGGAYSVTLLLEGDRETLWFNGDAELEDELDAVIATLSQMA